MIGCAGRRKETKKKERLIFGHQLLQKKDKRGTKAKCFLWVFCLLKLRINSFFFWSIKSFFSSFSLMSFSTSKVFFLCQKRKEENSLFFPFLPRFSLKLFFAFRGFIFVKEKERSFVGLVNICVFWFLCWCRIGMCFYIFF